MFAPDHEVTMEGAAALGIGLPWSAADMFRRSLVRPPDGSKENFTLILTRDIAHNIEKQWIMALQKSAPGVGSSRRFHQVPGQAAL